MGDARSRVVITSAPVLEFMPKMKTVFVGLSGGVDSSVTAALLKDQGYTVIGAYMKNWSQDLPGFSCPWFEDYQDAKRIAVQLGIPFELLNFETDYKKLVVDYMISEYKAGRTPNPDIMCNQEIKFRLFLDAATAHGADMIATGHYAKVQDGRLLMAEDTNKDQTYFLYRASHEALSKTIFPLGDYNKIEVRAIAEKKHLATANKKESMGICFVGKVGIKEFLSQYVETKPGPIINAHGQNVGEHDGAIFYTIGQRHGLNSGGGFPYYVSGKDMETNTVYVTTKLNDEKLWNDEIIITDAYWIISPPENTDNLKVRIRHRGPLLGVKYIEQTDEKTWKLSLQNPERAVSPGQSAVLYRDNECLGGGFIS